jgi:hypothetical protein
MKLAILMYCITFFISSCSNSVYVREKKEHKDSNATYEQVGGIPFYAKKAVYNQTTTYSQTWLTVTINVERSFLTEKDEKIENQFIDSQSYDRVFSKSKISELDKLKLEIISSGSLDETKVKDLITKFGAIEKLTDFNSVEAEMIGNMVKEELVTDYSKTYYLNAPLPWFGSSSLSQELSSEGTLNKAEAKPDTKLAEGISSLIPISDFLTAKYVNPINIKNEKKNNPQISAAIEKATNNQLLRLQSMGDLGLPVNGQLQSAIPDPKWWEYIKQINYKVTLSIAEKGFVYKFVMLHDKSGFKAPIPFDVNAGLYYRENVSDKPTSAVDDKEKEKDKSKSIGLSGTIKFPENWGK